MLNEVRAALDFLIEKFKLERFVYLSISIAALCLLVACAIIEYSNKRDYAIIAGIVGAGGALSYCCTQILKMWTDCLSIITLVISKQEPKRDIKE